MQTVFTLARVSNRWLNIALVGLAAIGVLAMFMIVFKTINAERIEREQVRLTNRVLGHLRDINRSALQAETGQRGYLITLNSDYLDPYRKGSSELPAYVLALREELEPIATKRQAALLDEIERSSEDKLEELAATVTLIENGELLEARRLVLTHEGRQAMRRLRTAITELEQIEQDILETSLEEARAAEGRTLPVVLALLFLVIVLLVLVARMAVRAAQAEIEASQAEVIAEARDRADLLAGELNHRVKNLFAMILAIVQMSMRNEKEAAPVLESVSHRIRALLTAHNVTQGSGADAYGSLQQLVEATLAPYRSDLNPAELSGPDVELPARLVTPLGLVLHELTTNAIKYGAWAHGGTVRVSWHVDENALKINWKEDGLADLRQSDQQGFGSQLMRGAARQLDGTIDREFEPDGCAVRIEFPLSEG